MIGGCDEGLLTTTPPAVGYRVRMQVSAGGRWPTLMRHSAEAKSTRKLCLSAVLSVAV